MSSGTTVPRGAPGAVHLTGCKHPGAAIQGDTLNSLVEYLAGGIAGAVPSEPYAADRLQYALDRLRGIRAVCEEGCKAAGVPLPYPKPE